MSKKQSIEEAAARLEAELAAIKPRDASMWAVFQACRPTIMAKRSEGVSWAQIADAGRAAGFPTASESNVRLATQAPVPLKKVARARRRKATVSAPTQPTTSTPPPAEGPAVLRNRYK